MAIIVVDQPAAGQTVITRPTFNFPHFTTPHGMLLLAQFVIAIIIFVIGAPIYLNIIAWLAWFVSHLLIWIYLFSLNERYTSNPPLPIVEFYFNAGTAALYTLSTLFCFISLHIIVGPFALINTLAYGASAFFLFSDWNNYRANTAAGAATLPK